MFYYWLYYWHCSRMYCTVKAVAERIKARRERETAADVGGGATIANVFYTTN